MSKKTSGWTWKEINVKNLSESWRVLPEKITDEESKILEGVINSTQDFFTQMWTDFFTDFLTELPLGPFGKIEIHSASELKKIYAQQNSRYALIKNPAEIVKNEEKKLWDLESNGIPVFEWILWIGKNFFNKMQIPLMENNGAFFHQQLDLYHFLENYKYVFDHYGTDRFNQVILKVQDLNSQWEVVKNEDIDEDFAKQVLLINAELDIISSELRLFLPYKFWEKKPLEIELTKEIKDLLANSHFPAEIREINHKLKKIYFKHEQLKISLNAFAKKYNIEKILNQLENQKETLYKHIGWMENAFWNYAYLHFFYWQIGLYACKIILRQIYNDEIDLDTSQLVNPEIDPHHKMIKFTYHDTVFLKNFLGDVIVFFNIVLVLKSDLKNESVENNSNYWVVLDFDANNSYNFAIYYKGKLLQDLTKSSSE